MKRGGELLVNESREVSRQEHEIRTDEELQRMLSDRIADKDRVIAELRTQLDKHTSDRLALCGGDITARNEIDSL